MKNISLIIPAKNEKESIQKTLKEISNYKFINEIIIVLSGKKDNTINLLKKFNVKIIIQKKRGYGAAIIEGFKFATNEFGCIFNADYSFNPKYLSQMIQKTYNYKFIFGSRYAKNGSSDDDTTITYIGNKIFTLLSKILLKIRLSDILFTYVLCNVKNFNKLSFKENDFRFCIELPFKVKNNSFKYTEIAVKERRRFAGLKKVNELKDGFLIFIKIITYFFFKK
jgi:glycosyltransferase involved in cell wall biosynthesis